MKKYIYCIFDKVGEEMSTTLMLANNEKFYLRDMSTAKLPPVMEEHLEDFDIYCLGEVETENLVIKPEKKFISHLGSIRKKVELNGQNILNS